jgi:3-hydroxyacyl-CoA dehydrogenase/enoyl-CoA hydratase/3-hydroxybutyryl-CoA epimerase
VAQRVKSRKIPESAVYVIEKMAHGFHRSGRAAGAGFYDYDPDGSQTLWSGLSVFKRGRSEPLSDETITQRLMLVQSLAALRLAGTGVAAPTELDRKAREGWGYPAALVGPIAQAEQVGRGAFDHACRGLAARFGDRFEPPSAQSAT